MGGNPALWQLTGTVVVAVITTLLSPSIMRRLQRVDTREDAEQREIDEYRKERADEYKALRIEYQTLETNYVGLRDECGKCRVENESLKRQVDDQQRRLGEIQQQVTTLTTDNERLKQQVQELRTENFGLYQQIAALRQKGT